MRRLDVPVVDGRIDADLAGPAYAARTRRRVRPDAVDPAEGEAPPGDSYLAWRTRREAAEAQAAEMRLREQAGELVRADAVRHAHARRLTALRESLLQLPGRLAPVLAAETDQRTVHDALLTALHDIMVAAAEGADR